MTVPTTGEEYAKLIEHMTLACEAAYRLSHLYGLQDTKGVSQLYAASYLLIGQQLEKAREHIVNISRRNLQ